MNYSFFGTCANDYDQLFGCLNTILEQSIMPREIILVNAGEKNIKNQILNIIQQKKIKILYIEQKLSRVKSLNLAIKHSTSTYSFRFDTRTRFSSDYAKNALKILNNQFLKAYVVGGSPEVIPESENFQSILCAEIMNRSYIFFYPKHRDTKYSGYSSSIYLGCFDTYYLKQIRFNEKKSLLSEDSLIINDFLERGLKAYISSNIKVNYISRKSFINILRLFNTYGYCRGNTILLSKKAFISARHLFVFIFFVTLFLIFLSISYYYLVFFPLVLFLFNFIGEILTNKSCKKYYLPFCGTLCQFSWILGFLWSMLSIFNRKNIKSNFIS